MNSESNLVSFTLITKFKIEKTTEHCLGRGGQEHPGKFLRRAVCIIMVAFLTALICHVWASAQELQPQLSLNPYGVSVPVDKQVMPRPVPLYPTGFQGNPGVGMGGAATIPISSVLFESIIPPIPNLQFGYFYNFGDYVNSGVLTAGYLLPVRLGPDDGFFAQANIESQNYWKTPIGYSQQRLDLSLGGGYRRSLGSSSLAGVNGFYDGCRLLGRWYSSGGVGGEFVGAINGNDVLDLNFNYYFGLFNGVAEIVEAFRKGPGNFDFEAGYLHKLFSEDYGLRLKAAGYKFDTRTSCYGWRAGADLFAWDGACEITYEAGHDRFNGTYHSVGATINLPFQLENVFAGQNPFVFSQAADEGSDTRPKVPCAPTEIPCMKPVPIYIPSSNFSQLLSRQVKRKYISYAIPDLPSDPDPAMALLAQGYAVVVFTLSPKYTAADLQNKKPNGMRVSVMVSQRGSIDITGLQLLVKDTETVWFLPLPDWIISMGNAYVYNLSDAQITSLWQALSAKSDRSIAEVCFNQLDGANLQNLNVLLTITP